MATTQKDTLSENKKLITLNDDLENYFRNTIIPQLFVDADLILRKFTPPAMRHFKLSPEDIGRHIEDISHRIKYPTFLEDINEVISSGNDFEKEVQTTDFRWFQMNILPYRVFKENTTNGVIITFVNITERIKNLKEIEKLNADHETFIYTISHDIKSPLGNLESLTQAFTEAFDNNSPDCKTIANMIGASVSSLKNLVTELTDISRTRHHLLKGESTNMEHVFEDVKLTLNDKIAASNALITVEFNVNEIRVIRKNIRSILYNLLSNAIKYKSPDHFPEIVIKTNKQDGFVALTVTDNGIGIEESKQKVIFSEFLQINKEAEGTGIGLYIVGQMMKNIGGEIKVESTIGQGSTFTLIFKE